MSNRDFEKYLLKNPVYLPASEQKRKLIVISDSKGFHWKDVETLRQKKV